MATNTLTSLAFLKVNVDQGRDYLDYLRPFILHILVKHNPNHPITAGDVQRLIREQFGLEIPDRTVQIVLQRISKRGHLKRGHLKKESGKYYITGNLPDPGIATKQSEAKRHINAVKAGLIDFSSRLSKSFSNPQSAENAICTFLAEFDISCLKAYLRGTALPPLADADHRDTDIVLVSKYIIHLEKTDPERFESFMIMVQGHMFANALLCPDLKHVTNSYEHVEFHLDTPLLVRYLGLEGKVEQNSIKALLCLLQHLKGKICAFSHSSDELKGVIKGAAEKINAQGRRGAIIAEALRQGTTKSDLLLLAGQIDEKLTAAKIQVRNRPPYITDFQIDENVFEQVLDDQVSYFNDRAKEYDINSVRSIYTLRRGTCPLSLEKSLAVLVTSNSGFARAAYNYGKQHEESREVSSVINDFSLANIAWLKAPMSVPLLPMTEVLAFSYAALQPSNKFMIQLLTEIDKLKKQGTIREQDHQLLRSDIRVNDELMNRTLGDDTALDEKIIKKTLEHVSGKIRKEEREKLDDERKKYQRTQKFLASSRKEKQGNLEQTHKKCRRRAMIFALILTSLVSLLLLAGFYVAWPTEPASVMSIGLALLLAFLTLFTVGNLFLGTTVKLFHKCLQDWCYTWLFKREGAAIKAHLSELDDIIG